MSEVKTLSRVNVVIMEQETDDLDYNVVEAFGEEEAGLYFSIPESLFHAYIAAHEAKTHCLDLIKAYAVKAGRMPTNEQ